MQYDVLESKYHLKPANAFVKLSRTGFQNCSLVGVINSPVRYFLSSSKLLPWFHPVLNPLIYYFFGSICGPLRHTLNVDGKNALVISNISYPVISVLTKWGRSTIRRGSDESDVSTIVDGEFQT